MRNVYQVLRTSSLIKSKRIRLLGIWLLHVMRQRYLGIFLDPVLACNFRCKMCYFSDEEGRKRFHGTFNIEDVELIAKALFHKALKLQMGCGAEPTIHKDLSKIIALGKKYRIPYISLTTNGSLLNEEKILELAEAGLNELTLSTHGLKKETYEYLMTKGKYEHFIQLLKDVSKVKEQYPDFRLRINYTVNNLNMDELSEIWRIAGDSMDIFQVRPVQKIGETEYSDFDLTNLYENYDSVFSPIITECKKRNIICLIPDKKNIATLGNDEVSDSRFEHATYCYVSPRSCWRDDFDYMTDTFESYTKREKEGRQLFKNIFTKEKKQKVDVSRKLNYNIK